MGCNRLVIIVITAATALLVSACGSSAEALSKPDYIEQANAICQQVHDEGDALFEEFFAGFEDWNPEDPETQEHFLVGFGELMDVAVPMFEQQSEDLRGLAPPKEDRDLVEALLDDMDSALEEMDELVDAAVAGDEAARARLFGDDDPFTDVNRRAGEYGLTVCGQEDA